MEYQPGVKREKDVDGGYEEGTKIKEEEAKEGIRTLGFAREHVCRYYRKKRRKTRKH